MPTNNHNPITVGESNAPATINTRLSDLDAAIGNLAALSTAAKSSAVAAINEVDAALDAAIGAVTADAEVVTARSGESVLDNRLDFIEAGSYNVKRNPYSATGAGSANDSTAIQAAITAAGNATGDGTVFFPPGTYKLQGVTIPAGVRLLAYPGTVIITPNANSITMFTIQGGGTEINGLTLQGDNTGNGILISASANLAGVKIRDCVLTGMKDAIQVRATTTSLTVSDVYIQNCTIKDATSSNPRAVSLTVGAGSAMTMRNIHIEGCTFADLDPEGSGAGFSANIYVGAHTVSGLHVTNNDVRRCSPLWMSMSGGTYKSVIVTGNVVDQEGPTNSINMGFEFVAVTGLKFADNTVRYVGYECILIANCKDFTISNCHFEWANVGVAINDVNSSAASYGTITGCTFTDCESIGVQVGHKAIYIASDLARVTISNCTFRRTVGVKDQIGIDSEYITTPPATRRHHLIVTGCNFYNMMRGIDVASGGTLAFGGYANVSNCIFEDCSTDGIQLSFAKHCVVRDCTFVDGVTDIKVIGDTHLNRFVGNVHIGTSTVCYNITHTTVDPRRNEISSCVFDNSTAVTAFTNGLTMGKRTLIYRDNIIVGTVTEPELVNCVAALNRNGNIITQNSTKPTNDASYKTGDICFNTNPTLDASNMVKLGWIYAGAAWEDMNVSDVSPAT